MSVLSSRNAVEDNAFGQRKQAAASAAANVTCMRACRWRGNWHGVAYHRGAPLSSTLSGFAIPSRLIVLRNLHIFGDWT